MRRKRWLQSVFTSVLLIVFACSKNDSSSIESQKILESAGEPSGWKRNAEIRNYTAENLWEYINGAAEQFVVYGVLEASTTDFVSSGDAELTVDVYRMKDPLNAFGVYSMERNTGGPFPSVGSEGCWNGSSLFFYKGDYYVKMIVFDEDENLRPAIQKLAESIAAVIPGEKWSPAELIVFPSENLISKSEKFYPANVLAQPFFSNGYTAQYRIGGVDVQAFVVFGENIPKTQESFRQYQNSLNDGARKFVKIETGDEAFLTTDSFYGKILTARSGPCIAGVMGKMDDSAAHELTANLLQNAAAMK